MLMDHIDTPGPVAILDRTKKGKDFYYLMFPLALCIWIANETNQYANQIQALEGQDARWQPAAAEDISVFLGIRFFVSIMD